ncbi:MAG: replication-associated recombination protein A [Candidatus Carbobacillus altaicus]|nr:replication-associated recombination protein A [Candidatus Carbobacillus altaicus]
MDLFDYAREQHKQTMMPLAARVRPETLDEIIGQEELLGVGTLLRRSIEADRLSSLIFYGPPGTGKTTLAKVIASTTKAHFTSLNAVTAGVADLRRVIEEAKDRLGMRGERTILFVDEIHRFNKAQQDALLPYVEDGTIILIGATTENPFFEVNQALLSRSMIFRLNPLGEEDLRLLLRRTLADPRAFPELTVALEDAAEAHLIQYAEGDARRLLNALELAVLSTPPSPDGRVFITLDIASQSIQRRPVRYDKSGDGHYDTISAYIKSMRGSDPDAALYYLALMLKAGEDPRFIARRLVIAASEDVGNAYPEALVVAMSAYEAVERIGMPEGRIPLAQATVLLALAPKSNSSYRAIHAYLEEVERAGGKEVPAHLRDAHYAGAKALGSGIGYTYAHDGPEHYVVQQYLPDGVPRLYEPGSLGVEGELIQRLARLRAQYDGEDQNGKNALSTEAPEKKETNEQDNDTLKENMDG